MVSSTTTTKQPYEAPVILVLGSLHQLTLALKNGKRCDVSCYHHGSG